MNLSLCLILGFSLCFSMTVFGSSELKQSQNQDPSEDSKCSVKCEDFKALENRNRELEKSHAELIEQVKSLSNKFDQLESKISEEDHLSMLRPPLRGPPGKQGERGEKGERGEIELEGRKGESGRNGEAGQKGEMGDRGSIGPQGVRGQDGQKGENGQPGPQGISDPRSITSCSAAMEILPSSRPKKQTIYPHGSGNNKSLEVLCDFEVDGGGWTVIQKRSRGPKDEFSRTWSEYVKGFGSLDGNFWLGLENVRALTKNGDQELRINLEDFDGNKRFAKYSGFSISDASDFYRLSLSGYAADSTAGDSMINPSFQSCA